MKKKIKKYNTGGVSSASASDAVVPMPATPTVLSSTGSNNVGMGVPSKSSLLDMITKPLGSIDSERPRGPRGPRGPREDLGPIDIERPRGPRGPKIFDDERPRGPRGPREDREPRVVRGPFRGIEGPLVPQILPNRMKKGGAVKSASARADGIAVRGKTRA